MLYFLKAFFTQCFAPFLFLSGHRQTTTFKVTLKKCGDCFEYILIILNECEVNLKYIRHFNNFEDHIFEIKLKNCCYLIDTLTQVLPKSVSV